MRVFSLRPFALSLRTGPAVFSGLAALLVLGGCRDADRPAVAGRAAPQDTTTTVPAAAGKYGTFPQIFADVAEGALPAVVSVYTETDGSAPGSGNPFGDFFGGPSDPGEESAPPLESGLGSGVIMSEDGTILTNNHVIEGATRIRVQLYDGREFDATVVGADPPTDLAVIRIAGASGASGKKTGGFLKGLMGGGEKFPAMPLGDSEKLRVGEWVIAVGSPYGLSQTVTTGIISAKGRHNTGINNYENFLQTDAAINPGNSGGALLNLRGELVGINTAIFSRSGGYQGIGFAIPIGMARKISADLIRDGAVTRGWLGVSIQPLDPDLAEALGVTERNGALVGGVIPGSPAEKAGVRRGDVITRIDKQAIPDPNTLLNHVALLAPGTWIEIGLNRAGRALTLKARITRRSEGARAQRQGGESAEGGARSYASLGLELEALTRELRRDYGLAAGVAGIVVTVVEEGGRGDNAGLQEGDVIVEANRAKVRGPRDFQEALRKAGKDGRILLLVNRAGETFFTAL